MDDDRQVNIEAAQAMGIHGIQFKSTAEPRIELEAAGFPILPPDAEVSNVLSI